MSTRKRLDALEGTGDSDMEGKLRGMTDQELLDLAAGLTPLLRRKTFDDLGPPSPALAHISDDELVARVAALRARETAAFCAVCKTVTTWQHMRCALCTARVAIASYKQVLADERAGKIKLHAVARERYEGFLADALAVLAAAGVAA